MTTINYEGLFAVFVLSLATTSISVTITKAKVFAPLRDFIFRIWNWLGELFSCPYCMSHWVAGVFVAIYRPTIIHKWIYIDLTVSLFVIVTISAIISGIILSMKGLTNQKPASNSVTGQ